MKKIQCNDGNIVSVEEFMSSMKIYVGAQCGPVRVDDIDHVLYDDAEHTLFVSVPAYGISDGDIMHTSNNHDHALVGRINELWKVCRPAVGDILRALYWRDLDEMYALDEDMIGPLPDSRFASPADMDRWQIYAHNYLQHVADDEDLRLIISFVEHGNIKELNSNQ